jgi:hypothetical protein
VRRVYKSTVLNIARMEDLEAYPSIECCEFRVCVGSPDGHGWPLTMPSKGVVSSEPPGILENMHRRVKVM